MKTKDSMPISEAIRSVIRARKTVKVLAEEPVEIPKEIAIENDSIVRQAVSDSGWAPFHYDRKIDDIAEPWRAHLLWHQDCRVVAKKLPEWIDDIKPGNKMAGLLNGCGALVVVTWLPVELNENTKLGTEKLAQVNEEHLAATSAMIQNLLLLIQANGLGSYWSSGGLLKHPTAFEKLGIDDREKMVAAVFVDYQAELGESDRPVQLVPGKLRDKRTPAGNWMDEISIDRE